MTEDLNTSATVDFNFVVASIQSALNDMSPRNKDRYLTMAVQTYAAMNIFHIGAPVTRVFKPNAAGIIQLSSDVIDYAKVGVVVNGKIVTLGYNGNISLHTKEVCGITYSDAVKSCGCDEDFGALTDQFGGTSFGSLVSGNYSPVFFGATGGVAPDYFRFDRAKRALQLNPVCVGREIVVECITTGISLELTTYVPRQCVDCIKNGVVWEVLSAPNSGASETAIARWEKRYAYSLQALQDMYFPTVSELLDIMYEQYRGSPKR